MLVIKKLILVFILLLIIIIMADNNQLIKYNDSLVSKYDFLLELVFSLINNDSSSLDSHELAKIPDSSNKKKLMEIKNTIQLLKEEEYYSTNYYNNLNQFDNISLLKSGGFGIVLKGSHKLDTQIYAIKLIPLKLTVNNNLKLFMLSKIREIRYLSSLSHPNIIRYHNSWIEFKNADNLSTYLKGLATEDIATDKTLENSISCSFNSNSFNSFNSDSVNSDSVNSDGVNSDSVNSDGINSDSTNTFDYDNLSNLNINCINAYRSNLDSTNSVLKPVNKHIYLAIQMEYMDFTFNEWCRTIKPSNKILYNVLYGLLDGIEYLHTRSPPIIHCDIKPDNILVKLFDTKWIAKIADFGLVSEENGIWRPNKYEGTLTYRAPEIGDESKTITSAVDIYSLGIVLYEITLNISTEMERSRCLSNFKAGIFKTATILDKMVAISPEERPSILEVKKYLQCLQCLEY